MEAKAAELAARMPTLAGHALATPKFHPVDWVEGQLFTAQDDPDRTDEFNWTTPGFSTATTDGSAVETTELEIPQANPAARFARVARGVLDESQCAQLIESVNLKGFTPALLNIGRGRQILERSHRDGHRVIVDSPEMAEWLLDRLRPLLPAELIGGWRLVGMNERLRILCYTPGQEFPEHCDGCYMRTNGECSKVTVQLYLNHVPHGCGGATNFFPNKSQMVGHQPEAGSVLIFTQDLPHEGALLTDGIKYTLRTEAMYQRLGQPNQALLTPQKANQSQDDSAFTTPEVDLC